ncbi:PadR family transcriptional regulator [Streptacidiphilus sp. EB129]|uniref:PadR family transcriptional regulator n=1 Tax=Streptacidiphilus sp. EB129 TaxID=3156262 RepID=UPI0035142EF7
MSLRHAVLGLLVDQPASGYDLMKRFNTSLANVWPATQSQVYGELARLADNGLIDVAAEGPRGRKEYTLTDAGLAELRRWLIEDKPEPRRSSVLLRVFFMGVLTPEQAADYLTKAAEQAAADHAALRQLQDSLDWTAQGPLTANGRLALEYGLRLYAMQEEWAQWAAGQIAPATG